MHKWTTLRLAHKLLFSTVRIETHRADGTPVATGTAFIMSHPFAEGREELFLVSNRHVVSGGDSAAVYFTRCDDDGSPRVGDVFFVKIDQFDLAWHPHPNPAVDLAIMPLSWQLDLIAKDPAGQAYVAPIRSNEIVAIDYPQKVDPFLPILFIGYPSGLFDEKHYTPIIRTGTTATPIDLDFSGEPAFLIDASVFPGSSGSPVFAYDLSIKGHVISYQLLGVLSAVLTQDDSGSLEFRPAPTTLRPVVSFRQLMDLGVVLHARLLREVITDFGVVHQLGGAA